MPGAYPRSLSSSLLVLKPSINPMENFVTRSEAQFDDVTAAQVLEGHLDERSEDARFDGETEGWRALDAKYALASSHLNDPAGMKLVTGLERRWELEAKDPRMGAPPKDGLASVHFGGGAKPWWVSDFGSFVRSYAPVIWLRWWRSADEAAAHLGCVGCGAAAVSGSTVRRGPLPEFDTLALCRPRTCENVQAHFATRGHDRIAHRLTVVLNTIDGSKIPLERLVAHYANATVVQRIVIAWHSSNPPPADPPRRVVQSIRGDDVAVTTLWRPLAAPSRRYALFEVPTSHVLIADDDVVVAASSLNALLAAAREGNGIASPLVMSHDGLEVGLNGGEDSTFSLASGRLQVVPAWLLFVYRCLLPPQVHAYIEAVEGCADGRVFLDSGARVLNRPQARRRRARGGLCCEWRAEPSHVRSVPARAGCFTADAVERPADGVPETLYVASVQPDAPLPADDARLSLIHKTGTELLRVETDCTHHRCPRGRLPWTRNSRTSVPCPTTCLSPMNAGRGARTRRIPARYLDRFMLRPQLPYDKFVQKARVESMAPCQRPRPRGSPRRRSRPTTTRSPQVLGDETEGWPRSF